MKKIFFNFSEKLIKSLFLIFILIYSSLNIFGYTYIFNDDPMAINHINFGINITHIIYTVFMMIIIYIIYKKIKISNKNLFIILSISIVLVSLYWIFTNNNEWLEYDDAYNIFSAATHFANGDFNSPLDFKSYLNMYPHNLGMTTYFYLHILIFKSYSMYSMRFANIIFCILAYYFLLDITKNIFKNENINKLLILIFFFANQLIFMNYYIYTNVASYSVSIISVAFLIRFQLNEKKSDLLIMIMCILFASLIKNNSLIILIAEIIYLLFYAVAKNKKYIYLVILTMFIGQYVVTGGLIKLYEYKTGYSFSESALPKIVWIATGLHYEKNHPGFYNGIIENFHYREDFNVYYTTLEAKKYINEALLRFKNNPINILTFYRDKFMASYTNNEYDAFLKYQALPQTELNKKIISGDFNLIIKDFYDSFANIISLTLIYILFKEYKNFKLNDLIFALIIIGGSGFHLFWEIKAIYLYQYYMYLLPYCAYGLYHIFKKINI